MARTARKSSVKKLMDLFSIFKTLPTPTKEDLQSFSVVQIGTTLHKVGKDVLGCPVLLISTTSGQNGPKIHLEHLEVQHLVRCHVINDKKTEEGTFTVIRCTNTDEELTRYFFNYIGPVLRILGPTPSSGEISRAIVHLVELFRALTQPSIKSTSGLWAELFVINNAKDPVALLNSWHSNPGEKYDFNSNAQRLEVKSTSGRNRIHHFSLEQLVPPLGCEAIVASLFVESSGGGVSLGDLIQRIKVFLIKNPELEEKLDYIVANTLGNLLRQSMNYRVDYQLAQESLIIFNAQSIPKISEPLPAGISDVHFKVDLTRCRPSSKQELLDAGGIFKSLVFLD
jgi:hypothetical protein